MKYKVLEPWEIFWKKVFDYIIQNKLPAYDVIFYVAMVPSVFHMQHKQLRKFLDTIGDMYELPKDYAAIAVYYLMRAFDMYAEFGYLPRRNYQGLQFLYDLIMQDYRSSPKEYTFQEAYDHDVDVSVPEIRSRSWYVIHSILANSDAENVKKFLEKTIKEEQEDRKVADENVGIGLLQGNIESNLFLKDVLKKWGANSTKEDMLKALNANIEGDKLIFDKNVLEHIYAMMLFVYHSKQEEKELTDQIDKLSAMLESFRAQYRGDVKMLVDEIEDLKQELMIAKNDKQIVYVKTNEDAKTVRAELENKYEKIIDELKSEIESWKELAKQTSTVVSKEEIKPLPKLTTILYFGLPNPSLFAYMLKYNVDVRQLSPLEPPSSVGEFPIVFNIDVATHKVWEAIKDKKPLIITGSNKEILSQKIVEWLLKSSADDKS